MATLGQLRYQFQYPWMCEQREPDNRLAIREKLREALRSQPVTDKIAYRRVSRFRKTLDNEANRGDWMLSSGRPTVCCVYCLHTTAIAADGDRFVCCRCGIPQVAELEDFDASQEGGQ